MGDGKLEISFEFRRELKTEILLRKAQYHLDLAEKFINRADKELKRVDLRRKENKKKRRRS